MYRTKNKTEITHSWVKNTTVGTIFKWSVTSFKHYSTEHVFQMMKKQAVS